MRKKMAKTKFWALVFLGLSAQAVQGIPISLTNFDSLILGAKIVGPVGPDVESTFVQATGEGVADFVSSVSCPAGFTACAPPVNPPGTIYTYVHNVTPGEDTFNDPPFPLPDTIFDLDNVTEFRLNFPTSGFNGTAGVSFLAAAAVLDDVSSVSTELLDDGSLVWNILPSANWNSGETMTFFWQTTQPPSGPGGQYGIANANLAGSAAGPLPTPVATVAEPGNAPIILAAIVWVLLRRRNRG